MKQYALDCLVAGLILGGLFIIIHSVGCTHFKTAEYRPTPWVFKSKSVYINDRAEQLSPLAAIGTSEGGERVFKVQEVEVQCSERTGKCILKPIR